MLIIDQIKPLKAPMTQTAYCLRKKATSYDVELKQQPISNPRLVKYKVFEHQIDSLPSQEFDKIIGPTDQGVIALVNTEQNYTQIHRIYQTTAVQGWSSQMLFYLKTSVSYLETHHDRVICDYSVYYQNGKLIQHIEKVEVGEVASIAWLTDEILLMGYSQYARVIAFIWVPLNMILKKLTQTTYKLEYPNAPPVVGRDSGVYKQVLKTLLKTMGQTKHWNISIIRRNPWVKNQFLCASKNDCLRVNLDTTNPYRSHPNDIVFRAEHEITDFKLVDQIILIVMVRQSSIFLVDQFTEQILAVIKDFKSAPDRLYLGPDFELDTMPLLFYNKNHQQVKTKDIQSTGAKSKIFLQRPFKICGELSLHETEVPSCALIGQDDYHRFRVVTLQLD
ncbi:hypothetical protein FGO68_gene13659 [Halteria grandinella]|uniref:Uncharacterized protein n=1 Tax=Halteria grandinella TaxID=5974 RepID=A0A8J8T3G7_HALGN|nr:hypothetical protein FGO68_gene13659 [Halteria grandinella]